MQSNKTGIVVAIVGVALAVVLFVVLQGGDGDDEGAGGAASEQVATQDGESASEGGSGEEQGRADAGGSGDRGSADRRERGGGQRERERIPTIVVRNGEPVGGVAELSFEQGDRIRFAVTSDVADHVHVHGYDVMKDVAPGQRVKFEIPATITGVFEVELEDRVVPLAEITVNPR